MVITHVVNRRNVCLTILATVLIAGLLAAPRAGATIAPDDPVPYAQVLGVIVGGEVVDQLGAPEVGIARGPGGCAPTQVVRKGLPLCQGDVITTQKKVMLKIAFGDPKDRNEVTIGSNTDESEVKISSASCERICQWFSSLRRRFTNRTRRVAFTNRSTVYEVVAEEDKTVTLYVFEGEVETQKIESGSESETPPDTTTKPEASPAPNPSPTPTAEPEASPAPSPSPTPTAEPEASPAPSPSPAPTAEPEASPAPNPSPTPTAEPEATPTPNPSPVPTADAVASPSPGPSPVVGLFLQRFDAEGNEDGPAEKIKDVCQQLRTSADAEIAIQGTTAEVAGDMAKYPNELNLGRRKDQFRAFRCDTFRQPDEPENFAGLGYTYNDWGNGERALELLDTAIAKWHTQNPNAQITSWSSYDKIRIHRAIALRQLGKHDEALEALNPMIGRGDLLDDAFNVRGSINYDKARKMLLADRTEAGTTTAKEMLDQAKQDFEAANRNSANPQPDLIIKVNLAQVFKTSGDIAQRLGDLADDPAQRQEKYREAVENYNKAISLLKESDKRNTKKIARLFQARVYIALAKAYTAMDQTELSPKNYDEAQKAYRGAINEGKTFADAYCGLGSLNLILRDSKAVENYRKCASFNPLALVNEVEIPQVVGLRRAEAIQILAEAGLEAEIVTEGETVVASRDPAPGEQPQPEKAKIGSKIKLTLRNRDQ